MSIHLSGLRAAAFGATALVALAGAAAADQVILDDLIVDGSFCVGFDCVNGEAFGFDTIRMKENNVRIKADDTSSSGSFPNVDWQLTFNDSSNGGANKFSIDDITNGRTPFTIEANTRSNQLYLSDSNKVGFGTSTPVLDLHIKQGNTPSIRLEQDGTSGFQAQTWDVAANETNFFVRDASNGSKLPFKVFPNAPTNALIIEGTTGDVGMGIASPTSAVHVFRSAGAALDAVKVSNTGGSFMTFENRTTGRSWFFTHENAATGRFIISRDDAGAEGMFVGADGTFRVGGDATPATGGMSLDAAGNLTIGGTLSESSDKNAKMAIVPVDGAEVLAKVAALPLSSWTYIHDADAGVRHIGPMAQDFRAAFGLGHNDTTISTLDTAGVALAAIQELNAQNAAQQALIAELSARIQQLEETVAD
ncbi:tail fiber domain-containing protein [Tropicibacter sp. S64]|uniref:tail fiber domain-containing protein n=1 Tax=Tropicibacter sp. S64 TaxID=3415122 RepID=UPI003C7B3F02